MTGRHRLFSRFWRSRRGATAVEFALVAGPLLFLIIAVFELGIVLYADHSLQKGVQEAGRLVRTGQVTTDLALRQEICSHAPVLRDCETSIGTLVRSGATFTALPDLDVAAIVAGTSSFARGSAKDAVVVAATFDWDFFTPLVIGGVGRQLSGVAVFRNEPI